MIKKLVGVAAVLLAAYLFFVHVAPNLPQR